MTKFRPCIDLHAGHVKQIVGRTLDDSNTSSLKTNFISEKSAGYYANLYRQKHLTGAHVILLGPGNDDAAKEALAAWPGGLQVGGGVTVDNAKQWIDAGADKVIITSYLFPNATFVLERLDETLDALGGDPSKLVIDLSCRKQDGKWLVAMNKWQRITGFEINQENIKLLESYCSEFLIHAADVEGLQQGIDEDLVSKLSEWCTIPVTYAGGARHISDLDLVERLSKGKVDLTIGSALDIFGGSLVSFEECIEWNRTHNN